MSRRRRPHPLRALRRALAALAAPFTPTGRGVLLLGVVAAVAGVRLGWAELTVLAAVCLAALVLAVPQLLRPGPDEVGLRLRPASTVVGTPGTAVLTVRAGALPLPAPVVATRVSGARTAVRMPTVPRRQEQDTAFDLPARRRGIHLVGPTVHETSDLLGLLRRSRTWAAEVEFAVRPRTVLLDSLSTGVMSDLEGAPSSRLAASDLAFHALREYVPGDDLRHVHWRSSARSGALLVRQYQETTRSHATVVLDADPASYGGDADFELAVSVAASIAVRATLDDFEVTWSTGPTHVTSGDPETLLDHACRVTSQPDTDLTHRVRRVAATVAGTSLVAVVSGAGRDAGTLRDAASAFGTGPRRVVVRADSASPSRLEDSSGLRVVRLAELDHLAALLDRAAG